MPRFLLLLCLVAGLAQAAPPAPAVTVVNAEFGLFDASDPTEIAFEPALVVPHVEGQRYGWVIELRTAKRSVSVREEYLLTSPEKAAITTAADGRIEIPLPRRNQVSQRQLVPAGGRIIGEWAIGPQEPPGKRHLQVIVEGEVAGDFEYEVK